LSSGDTGLVNLLLATRYEAEHLASDVTLQGSNGVEFGMSLGDPLGHICFRFRIGSQAADGYDVQGAVSVPIAAAVNTNPQ
jgi:hypothetical protein